MRILLLNLLTYVLLLLCVSCAAQPAKDPSVPEQNNHFRIEMQIDNITSVGMLGVSYTDRNELKDKSLSFFPVYEGSLELYSERCEKNISVSYSKGQTIKIGLLELLPSFDTTCSYRITRRVIGADNAMVGYFVIGYFKDTLPLKVRIGSDDFTGVSYLQLREGDLIPHVSGSDKMLESIPTIDEPKSITLFPKGTRGKVLFKGCNASFAPLEFDKTPITINLSDAFSRIGPTDSCDYEIVVVNYDNPAIEENIFSLNVYKKETQWLEAPFVSNAIFKKIKVSYVNPYVLGISVDDKVCYNTQTCIAKCNGSCTVRAITTSGRFFWGLLQNGNFTEVK